MKILWTASLFAIASGTALILLGGTPAGSAEEEHKTEEHKTEEHKTEEKPVAKKAEPARPSVPGACLADAAAIEDVKKAREDIEARRKEIAAKEADLKARETAINEELKKLESAREDIAKSDAARKKENEEKVTKVVETLESMNPKAASKLLSELDETLAVAAIARISTSRLAKIMNVMETGRSSRLTEILAGVVRTRKSNTLSEKGGDKNDGQNTEQSIPGSSKPEDRKPGNDEQKAARKGSG